MRTGTECRKALHDELKVWVLEEGLIEDVTWHPAPARSSMSMPPGMTAILTRGGGTSCSLRRTSGATGCRGAMSSRRVPPIPPAWCGALPRRPFSAPAS